MEKFSPAFGPSPRDSLDDILWPQDLVAQHDFFDGPLEARPGHEIIGPERTSALGSLAVVKTEKTPQQLAAETATFGHLAAILATGGALGNVNAANYDGMVWRPTLVKTEPDFSATPKLGFNTQISDDDSFKQYTLPAAA